MPSLDDFIHIPRIAYFTMEIALRADIPTYSGGLGVLAGDTVRTAADLTLPLVAVSLVSHHGYFRQEIDADGRQHEAPDPWDPAQYCKPLRAKVTVPVSGHDVWVGGWLYILQAPRGGQQPVILLDTNFPENHPEDRGITDVLYGGDEAYRLKQEIVLGIGGTRILRAIGFHIQQYHMNEGHSALLTLQLLHEKAYSPEGVRPGEARYDIPRVRELCNFTTHTPVEAGHDQFSYQLAEATLGDFIEPELMRRFAGDQRLNMTRLALNLSDFVNGVAKRHAEVSRGLFPGYSVRAITNGVHPSNWTAPGFARLYDKHLPGWCHEPELLVRADCCIADAEIWQAHSEAKQTLIERVQRQCGITLHPKIPILGFARRMTAYKRPELLFTDLARLKAIAGQWPFQVVLAGKAHPRDETGKQAIAELHRYIRALAGTLAVVFIPNYDMDVALDMVAGADVWLNTPLRPFEASGTSGMKAAFNGVPNLSVLDGWWIEGCIENVTGWAIGRSSDGANDHDAGALYDKLEQVVLPLYYYADRAKWIAVMKGAIAKNASFFNSHRMMRRYVTEAYLR